MADPIYVTKSIVPDFREYSGYLETIFASRHMANGGAIL
jgi:hypothetical protein